MQGRSAAGRQAGVLDPGQPERGAAGGVPRSPGQAVGRARGGGPQSGEGPPPRQDPPQGWSSQSLLWPPLCLGWELCPNPPTGGRRGPGGPGRRTRGYFWRWGHQAQDWLRSSAASPATRRSPAGPAPPAAAGRCPRGPGTWVTVQGRPATPVWWQEQGHSPVCCSHKCFPS